MISAFAAMSCGPTACVAVLQRRVIGPRQETQSRRDAGGSGLQGIGADSSPVPELRTRLSVQNPSQKGGRTMTTTFWLYPGCKRRIRWSLMEPKQARNSKDLKGLKCRYTLGIRA